MADGRATANPGQTSRTRYELTRRKTVARRGDEFSAFGGLSLHVQKLPESAPLTAGGGVDRCTAVAAQEMHG